VGLGWHDPIREPCTYRLERVACGKEACGTCKGVKPAHGPYWYAYWETGGRSAPQMHKRYIGRARPDASPDELRELFERRQQARADATRRRTRRGSTSSGSTSSSGKQRQHVQRQHVEQHGSSGSTSSSGRTSSGGTSAAAAPAARPRAVLRRTASTVAARRPCGKTSPPSEAGSA
jgi:hypothetical protein